jgi:hypothetical protein
MSPDSLSLPAAFLDDVLEEYRRDGKAAIERLRIKDPRAYAMLTACLLPQFADEILRALEGERDG